MFFYREIQNFTALFTMSSHWTIPYLPWILYTLTLCLFHIYREILFPFLCHLRITHFKGISTSKFFKVFLTYRAIILSISSVTSRLISDAFSDGPLSVYLLHEKRLDWKRQNILLRQIAYLRIMYNTYIYTEWPKKCIHSLLINIFGINLNEISISGWECNIMFSQQMAQALL